MLQATETKELVPESGVEPERPKTRDFKSQEAPATSSKALNYKESKGTIKQYFSAVSGTKSGTRISGFILALLALLATPLHAQSVYWNPANSAPTTTEADIRRAVWIWSERLNWPLHYAGTTNQSCIQGGAITLRTLPQAEWTATGAGSLSAFTGTCSGAPLPYDGNGFIVAINPSAATGIALWEHELGHALGAWSHSFDPYSIMYPQAFPANSIATRDVLAVFNGMPFWPRSTTPDFCFAELRADRGIFHPDIEGHAVMLDYAPLVVDGATVEHRWELAWRRPNAQSQGCDADEVLADGTVYLSDVRALAPDLETTIKYSASLVYVGPNTWALATINME